jgi:hypothetical protein
MRKLMTLVFAAAVTACGGGGSDSPTGTNPGGQTPAFDIALSGAALSVQQGATSPGILITVTRSGGFAANVDLSVEGTPVGITALLTPASVASGVTTSTLAFVAGASAVAGTTNLTIRAKGAGLADKTASVALTVTAAPFVGGFTLSASPVAGSITQGASGTSTITVTRTGAFTGAVALTAAVTGAPAGVSVSLNPASVTGTTSTLTIATTAAAAPATYTITISGTGAGVANQSATVTAVVASAGPPPTGNATWTFCFANAPIWFAVQDGLATWARVTPGANSDYKFSINSPTGGVAYVTSINGSFVLNIVYGTQAELVAQGTTLCPGGLTKTLSGTVGGLDAGDVATIALGGVSATASGNTSYILNTVPGGVQDLIASDATIAGTSFATQVKKIILRRNQNPANNASLPVLDFSASEAFAPASATLTLANGGADVLSSTALYFTTNGAAGAFSTDASSNATRTYYGVPSAQQATGDLHAATAIASVVNFFGVSQVRSVSAYFKDVANKTLTFGPVPSSVTVAAAATTPVVRLRAQWSVQSEYNKFFLVSYSQAVGATTRTVTIRTTATYLGGNPTAIDQTMPDLSAVSGWDNNWGFRAGTVTNYTASSVGWNFAAGSSGNIPLEGGVVLTGQKLGSLTP